MTGKTITGGVLIPACSPCDENGTFLEKEFAAAVERYVSATVDGIYVCGGTGEGTEMRLSERKAACEIAVDIAHRHGKSVLTQVGAYTMRDAVELAAHAAAVGSDGISSIALQGKSHSDQMNYYRRVIDAAGIPTVLYYMPKAGSTFSIAEVLETLTIPGVMGIKSSPNDFFFTLRLMAEKPDGTILFNGKDEYSAAAAIQGADGGIGMWAAVFPEAYAGIYRRVWAGKLKEAFDLQQDLNRLCFAAFRYGLLQSFECIHRYLGYWDRVFRAPAPRFTEEFYERFIAEAAPLIDRLAHVEEV